MLARPPELFQFVLAPGRDHVARDGRWPGRQTWRIATGGFHSRFEQALAYAAEREAGLRVVLEDPEVAIDTNHLERGLRPSASSN